MTNHSVSEQIHLVQRPDGVPGRSCFKQVSVPLPPLTPGEVRVVSERFSVDPYMRGRMSLADSYVEPYELGQVMDGGAVGRVVESRSTVLRVGDVVTHDLGWRDVAQGDAAIFTKVTDPDIEPEVYLSALGVTGFTAYVGLVKIAELNCGETVFVSGAAGAVGAMVGQLAKLMGAGRVVGSAGSAEKVRWLVERAGFDAAFNYRDGDPVVHLKSLAPHGIDVYFDNVGGPQLEAAITVMNPFARAAICGSISNYNSGDLADGPQNLGQLITKSLTLKGFIVTDHQQSWEAFRRDVGPWVRSGEIVIEHTVVEGIDRAVEAFLGLFTGQNLGKMLVHPVVA